jgi:hypothetical protein
LNTISIDVNKESLNYRVFNNMSKKYLYIPVGGAMYQSNKPSPGDYERIKSGDLTVLAMDITGVFLVRDPNTLEALPNGIYETVNGEIYHKEPTE